MDKKKEKTERSPASVRFYGQGKWRPCGELMRHRQHISSIMSFYSVYSVSHDYNSIYTFNIQYGQRNHPGICAPQYTEFLCLPLYQKYMAEARR